MPHLEGDIALLTDPRYTATFAHPDDWYLDNILRDDRLLVDALARRGASAVRVDWSRTDVDWSRFRCAVFRTTWDYFDRFDEFTNWLNRVESQTQLCNPAALVRWNTDKHYLADLESRGIPVVAARYVERSSTVTLHELLAETGWNDAVIKPCVSGAARHTYRIAPGTLEAIEPIFRELLASESFILQPFQPSIMLAGEDTLMVFGGRYSHAVRKIPKAGDFRVQDDHGGRVLDRRPTADQIALAERAVAACSPVPAYGRVDMIRDDAGHLAVMELELIEPELWLRNHPRAAENFASAIVNAFTL